MGAIYVEYWQAIRSSSVSTVGIISCTRRKRSSPLPAERLYASELFFGSRRYAQSTFDRWLILSAKHGLVEPGQIIEPYEQPIEALSAEQLDALAQRVKRQARAFEARI